MESWCGLGLRQCDALQVLALMVMMALNEVMQLAGLEIISLR